MQIESQETESGNWRASVRELTDRILHQYRIDRESGMTTTVRGRKYRLAACSIHKLRELARMQAIDRTREAVARDAA